MPSPTDREQAPSPEALEAARRLLDQMCIEWNEQDDDCRILALALDRFAERRVMAFAKSFSPGQREWLLDEANKFNRNQP